jgi:hypothetical protein
VIKRRGSQAQSGIIWKLEKMALEFQRTRLLRFTPQESRETPEGLSNTSLLLLHFHF